MKTLILLLLFSTSAYADDRSCFTKALAASEATDYDHTNPSLYVRCEAEQAVRKCIGRGLAEWGPASQKRWAKICENTFKGKK